jgi:N6-adenosine-specific RNA methylase IME4
VIAADPPWPYELRQEDPSHRGAVPYPAMSIDQICAMGDEVRRIAHENCVLLLWTTNNHMREAYLVAEAWGFEVKTIVTWFKDKMGMGDWLRGQTEHFLVCVRGHPTVVLTNETTALFGKVRGHSEKPEEFYEFVEKWAPAPRYAELFSRHKRENWDGHGDEHPSEAECAS